MAPSVGAGDTRGLALWGLIVLYMIDPVMTDAFPHALSSSITTPIAVILPMAFAVAGFVALLLREDSK